MQAAKHKRLGRSSQFNVLLCHAFKAANAKKYKKALGDVNKALDIFPQNKEARFYQITFKVNMLQAKNSKKLAKEIEGDFSSFIKDKDSEHMLYYFRGLFKLYKQNFTSAIEDMTKAMDYSETTVGKYHLGRARGYACIGMFNEAIQDLTTAIDSSPTLVDAYVLRGKCAFINGDTKQAYADFQRAVSLRPEDPVMHVHGGNILVVSGAYEEAKKAYTRAYDLGKLAVALFGRAKCCIALCLLPEAVADVSVAAKADAQKFKGDLAMLTILNKLCQSQGSVEVWEEAKTQLNELIASVEAKVCETEQSQLMENIELSSDPVFAYEDFVLYRGIVNFYLNLYSSAISVCIGIKG